MIKSIIIKNFKSHKNTVLKDLSNGLNVIIGDSDAGKSAIIQALRWVIFNRPVGNNFRSTWGGKTSVIIEIENYQICRWKGTDGNGYWIKDLKTKKKVPLVIEKQEVPEEVKKLLLLTDINVKTQFDPHFLLGTSSGEVAQYFNRIAHLDKIDHGVKTAKGLIRTTSTNINICATTLENLTEELKSYDYLDVLEEKVIKLEKKEEKIETKKSKQRSLANLLVEIGNLEEAISESTTLISMEIEVTSILNCFDKISLLTQDYNDLNKFCAMIEDIDADIDSMQSKLINVTEIDDILLIFEEVKSIFNKKEKLEASVTYLENLNNSEKKSVNNLKKLEKKFFKEIGDICPLCEQPIAGK